jgi:GcrA cell cycle regulator
MMADFWTEGRIEMLRKLAAEGFSGSEIAKKMRGTTRSAVLGKALRSDIALSGAEGRRRTAAARRAANEERDAKRREERRLAKEAKQQICIKDMMRPVVPEAAPIVQLHAGVNSSAVARAVFGLMRHHCKFPVGETSSPDFRFCGEVRAAEGVPYCLAHCKVAFQPRVLRDGANKREGA